MSSRIMLIVEADSEEGVLGMLERVPCWDASATAVARLHAFEEISGEPPAGSGGAAADGGGFRACAEPSGGAPAGSGVASLDRAREERGRQGREGKRHRTGTEPPP